MCGIAGTVGLPAPQAVPLVEGINCQQRDRGPDRSAAVAVTPSLVMGNTRLAIVGLSGGLQPLGTGDGEVWVVFNGEIYNHRELRTKYGLRLDDPSDGAVLPELYRRLGPSFLSELRGMFAICVADLKLGHVLLARDFFGQKPLHYRQLEAGLVFASSARALLDSDPPRMKTSLVADFLAFGCVPVDEGPDDRVARVGPGTYELFDLKGKRTAVQPWAPALLDGEASVLGQGQRVPDLRGELLSTTELHLRADVPSALLLSGGVDSTAVAWAAAELGHSLQCFTVDVIGNSIRSEAEIAAETARRLGHPHTVVVAELDEFDVRRFLSTVDSPTIDGLNTWLVSREVARAGLKVAVAGTGGDEVFGGYTQFKRAQQMLSLRRIGLDRAVALVNKFLSSNERDLPRLRKAVSAVTASSGREFALGWRRLWSDREMAVLGMVSEPQTSFLRSPAAEEFMLELAYSEIDNYLSRMLLPDSDAFSMAHSLELRLPLVDAPFMHAALTMSRGRWASKGLLAHAIRNDVVTDAYARPKQGFGLPMAEWLSTGPISNLRLALRSQLAPVWQVMPQAAFSIANEALERRMSWNKMWSLIVLNAWLSPRESP